MDNIDKQKIEILARKRIIVNEVTEVNAFNDQKIVLSIADSNLTVIGENLKITCFDKNSGQFIADGKIVSVMYDYKKEPILKRLFK